MTGVLAILLALTGTVPAVAQDNVIDEVVWVVGDEAILKSDVENERLNAQYEGRRFDGDPLLIIISPSRLSPVSLGSMVKFRLLVVRARVFSVCCFIQSDFTSTSKLILAFPNTITYSFNSPTIFTSECVNLLNSSG